MTDFPSYAFGTVTVAANGTVVTGAGTIWSGVNGRAGDDITIGGNTVIVNDVTDDNHLVIDAWPYAAVTDGTYKITQRSPLRFVGGQAMADVSAMIARINTQGFVWTLPPGLHSPAGYVAEDGQYIEDTSTRERWRMTSGAWVSEGVVDPVFSRYDIVLDVPSRPASGATLGKWVAPSLITFRAGLTESAANADTAATASTVFSIKKNGTEFATATFAAAGTTATFACAADANFNSGDVLTMVAPARDDTLSDIAFTIVGFR
jgi:hypothetical protein